MSILKFLGTSTLAIATAVVGSNAMAQDYDTRLAPGAYEVRFLHSDTL